MLTHHKVACFNRWFVRHIDARLRRQFDAVVVQSAEDVRQAARKQGVLLVANHTSWWDALSIVWVSARILKLDAYCLMDAENLQRAPFFRLLGAFGVRRQSAIDGGRCVRYASSLLRTPGRVVWWFPQGEERPVTQRPLGFASGSMALQQHDPSIIACPVALRYEFGASMRPTLYMRFGTPSSDTDPTHETRVQAQLDALEDELCERTPPVAFEGWRREPNQLIDAPATRALSFLVNAFLRLRSRSRAMPPSPQASRHEPPATAAPAMQPAD